MRKIIVVPFYQKENEYDNHGRITLSKGYYVDYGVDSKTLETICLPWEPFEIFVSRECIQINNEYILK